MSDIQQSGGKTAPDTETAATSGTNVSCSEDPLPPHSTAGVETAHDDTAITKDKYIKHG